MRFSALQTLFRQPFKQLSDQPAEDGLPHLLEAILGGSDMDPSYRRQLKTDLLAAWPIVMIDGVMVEGRMAEGRIAEGREIGNTGAVKTDPEIDPDTGTSLEEAEKEGISAWPVVAGAGVPVLLGIAAWVWHRYAQRQQPA